MQNKFSFDLAFCSQLSFVKEFYRANLNIPMGHKVSFNFNRLISISDVLDSRYYDWQCYVFDISMTQLRLYRLYSVSCARCSWGFTRRGKVLGMIHAEDET